MSKVLELALCLFPNVTALDYQGAVELLDFISPQGSRNRGISSPHLVRVTYLSHTLEPVIPGAGPKVLPERIYDDITGNEQFDIIFIPGGRGARPGSAPTSLMEFVKRQAPRAKYLLTVCTGSWILAGCGFLDGKRATTNKRAFQEVKASTSDKIIWVAKARWVVDGNIWTSSGVTAGMDMANAFLVHLVGHDIARRIRGVVELSSRDQDDDEFAAFHGLV
ncbi:class I glutamine amidotransferase-like protein [Ramaria rubella]|nr:class I glutamine amidotransferase-like protein [Ramaria rubella]